MRNTVKFTVDLRQRSNVENVIERLIAALDGIDGDTDSENCDEAQEVGEDDLFADVDCGSMDEVLARSDAYVARNWAAETERQTAADRSATLGEVVAAKAIVPAGVKMTEVAL